MANPIPFGSGQAGVELNEINNSFYSAPVNNTINAQIFILSDFGPVNKPQYITSVQQFEQLYGPLTSGIGNGNTLQYPYTSAELLLNTVNLWVTRVGVGTSATGTPGANAVLTGTSSISSQLVSSAQSTVWVNGIVQASYPGVGGNLIAIKNDLTVASKPTFSVYFNGVLVESYDYYNNQSGLAVQINAQSNYIQIPTSMIMSFTNQLSVPLYYASNRQPVSLSGGSDDQITEQTIVYSITSSPLFNKSAYALNYVVVGGYTEIYPQPSGDDAQSIISALTSLVEARQDCMLLGELPSSTTISSIATLQTSNPSVTPALGQYYTTNGFTAIYYPWVYDTDPISGYNVYLPPSIYVMPIFVNIDKAQTPQVAPAGFIRGGVNAIGLQYNPSSSDQDLLQFYGINPIMNFVANGIYVWGEKTQVQVRSALDRIHQRKTATYLEQQIVNIAQNYLFSEYTTTTINNFVSEITQLLTQAEKKGMITYFQVNPYYTPAMIDQHSLTVNVQIIPTGSIEYITLNFTIESNTVVQSEQTTA